MKGKNQKPMSQMWHFRFSFKQDTAHHHHHRQSPANLSLIHLFKWKYMHILRSGMRNFTSLVFLKNNLHYWYANYLQRLLVWFLRSSFHFNDKSTSRRGFTKSCGGYLDVGVIISCSNHKYPLHSPKGHFNVTCFYSIDHGPYWSFM